MNIDIRGGTCGACGGPLVGVRDTKFPLQCLECGSGRAIAIPIAVSIAEQQHQAATLTRRREFDMIMSTTE